MLGKRFATSIKIVDVKIYRLIRIIDIKLIREKQKESDDSEEEKNDIKEDVEVEQKDKEEESIIIIARLIKKIINIKIFITATAITSKNTLKINKNSLDL